MINFTKDEIEFLNTCVETGYFSDPDPKKNLNPKILVNTVLLKNEENTIRIYKEKVADPLTKNEPAWLVKINGDEPVVTLGFAAAVKAAFHYLKKDGYELTDLEAEEKRIEEERQAKLQAAKDEEERRAFEKQFMEEDNEGE